MRRHILVLLPTTKFFKATLHGGLGEPGSCTVASNCNISADTRDSPALTLSPVRGLSGAPDYLLSATKEPEGGTFVATPLVVVSTLAWADRSFPPKPECRR
jgi:hypothetical protein